jgi:uncharacterized repeat protein (TIGR03803 family)
MALTTTQTLNFNLSGNLDGNQVTTSVLFSPFQSALGALTSVTISLSATATTKAAESWPEEDGSAGTEGHSDIMVSTNTLTWGISFDNLYSLWQYYYPANTPGGSFSWTLPYQLNGEGVSLSPKNGGTITVAATGVASPDVGDLTGNYVLSGSISVSEVYTPLTAAQYLANAIAPYQNQSDFQAANNALADIINLRQTDATSSADDLALRDAEYFLRGYIGSVGLISGQFSSVDGGVAANIVNDVGNKGGPITTAIYNGIKLYQYMANNAVSAVTGTTGAPIGGVGALPSSPPGGAWANYQGWMSGFDQSLSSAVKAFEQNTAAPATQSDATHPLQSGITLSSDQTLLSDYYVAANSGGSTYIDPSGGTDYVFTVQGNFFAAFDIVDTVAGRSWYVVTDGHTYDVMPGENFSLSADFPNGVSDLAFYTNSSDPTPIVVGFSFADEQQDAIVTEVEGASAASATATAAPTIFALPNVVGRAELDAANGTPTLTGWATPGSDIDLVIGDSFIGTAIADASSGIWSTSLQTALPSGSYKIVAQAADNPALVSAPLALMIDPPIVMFNDVAAVTNGHNAILGDVAPVISGDALSTTLLSDSSFITGSSLSIVNGQLIYTPGEITGNTTLQGNIIYQITDNDTGATTTETQSLVLDPISLSSVVTFPTGADLNNSLVTDSSDNLFGITFSNGTSGYGTIFEITNNSKSVVTLYNFSGQDGTTSGGGLTIDADGNLYGTISAGDSGNDGTIFELAKDAQIPTTLATFASGTGSSLTGDLIIDADGDLFGAAVAGGAAGYGSVFELVHGSSSIKTLANFDQSNGQFPSGLVLDKNGNLFGRTPTTIFEIANGSGSVTTLATFGDGSGSDPLGTLELDSAGNIYGTTFNGGSANDGTIYELPAGANRIQTLASFTGDDGAHPEAGLYVDAAGNLFGTTTSGGDHGAGTAFALAAGASSITAFASFDTTDDASPSSSLVNGGGGVLYGTATNGTDDAGTVFALAAAGLQPDLTDNAPCYCKGTLIRTSHGEITVEELAIGDLVVTASGALRPIKWIGKRSYAGRFIVGNHLMLPVTFRTGSLADNVPHTDLHVSPGHGMFVGGQLVPAWRLVNGVSITQAEVVESVTYYHVELDRHAVILAEGAPAESFLDDGCRGQFHNAKEFDRLYPDAAPMAPLQPRLEDGFALLVIQERLAARAGITTPVEPIGSLRGFIDVAIPERVTGWAQDEDSPEEPVALEISANGVPILCILANGYRADLRQAAVGSGCHAFDAAIPTEASGLITVRRVTDGSELARVAAASIPDVRRAA